MVNVEIPELLSEGWAAKLNTSLTNLATAVNDLDDLTQDLDARTEQVVSGSAEITNMVKVSQAAYDALATKVSTTLYVIVG